MADVSVYENKGPAQFTVTLSHASTDDVTVGYRTVACSGDGCAISGTDYTFTSSTLTITKGDNRGTIDVSIIDDIAEEGDETFTLQLVSPTNATILDQEATATILDDDGPPRITIADIELDEDEGPAQFTVTLSHAADTDVTVQYATFDGPDQETAATQPYDYTATAGTLTIPKDDTTATISVTIIDDNIAEGVTIHTFPECDPSWPKAVCDAHQMFPLSVDNVGSETFLLRLDNPTGATLDDAEAIGEITDDEEVPKISGIPFETEANEDDGHIVFRPTLSHPSIHTVSAVYTFSNVWDSCLGLGRTLTAQSPPVDAYARRGVHGLPGTTIGTIRVPVYNNANTRRPTRPSIPTPPSSIVPYRSRLRWAVENGAYSADTVKPAATIWDDEKNPVYGGPGRKRYC